MGCGAGHWGQRLLPHLGAGALLQGVDHEPAFLGRAAARAAERGVSSRCRYEPGRAETLPFPAGAFDLVTCQTVLQHVADPAAALGEMLRVLRPGGLLLLSEPDNGASLVAQATGEPAADPSALADRLRLHLTIVAGKRRLGWGDDDIGGRLPGLLAALGVQDVRVMLNDQCAPLVPPYAAPGQEEERRQLQAAAAPLDDPDARRAFLAGGGDPDAYPRLLAVEAEARAATAAAAAVGRLARAGGVVHYLIGARKPGG